MVSKKSTDAFASAEPRRRQRNLEEFYVETMNLGKWTKLSSFVGSCIDFEELFNTIGWTKYLDMRNTWFHEPYAHFWDSAKEVDGTLVGVFEGKSIVVSADTIAAASGCSNSGKVFSNDWEKNITDVVDEVLYGQVRPKGVPAKDVTYFLRSTNMKAVNRLLHNFLFHVFFSRMGSKDNVTRRDRFYLFYTSAGRKLNLP